jgi:hypothetical protein
MVRWFESERIERSYPIALGLSTAVYILCFRRHEPLPSGLRDVVPAVLNIAAICVGFLGATMSILLTIDRHWIMQRIRESGSYRLLAGYITSSTRAAFFLAVGSAISLSFKVRAVEWWHIYAFALWSGCVVFTAASVYRVLVILCRILRAVSDPER